MLKVNGLTKDFDKVRIINAAQFEVKGDEIVALVGPNGAGKTTLVNLISGHILPTSGKIEFSRILNGDGLRNSGRRKRYGAKIDRTTCRVGNGNVRR